MKGKTHIAFGCMLGAVAAVATYKSLGTGDPIIYGSTILVGTGIGSLVPDIDAENALITQKLGLAGKAVAKGLKHRGITHTLLGLFIFALSTLALSSLVNTLYDGGIVGRILVAGVMTLIFSCLYKRIEFIRVSLRKLFKQKASVTKLISYTLVFLTVAILSDYFIQFIQVFSLSLVLGYLSHLISDSFNVSGCPWLYPFINKYYSVGKFRTGQNDGVFLSGALIIMLIALVLV